MSLVMLNWLIDSNVSNVSTKISYFCCKKTKHILQSDTLSEQDTRRHPLFPSAITHL